MNATFNRSNTLFLAALSTEVLATSAASDSHQGVVVASKGKVLNVSGATALARAGRPAAFVR